MYALIANFKYQQQFCNNVQFLIFTKVSYILCAYFIPQDLSDLKETIDLLNLALTRNLARSIVIEGTTVHK